MFIVKAQSYSFCSYSVSGEWCKMWTLTELGVTEVSVCKAISNKELSSEVSLSLSEENRMSVCVGKKGRVLMSLITDRQTGRGLSR